MDNCTNEQKIALYLETDKPELKKILLKELFKKNEKLIHKLVNKFTDTFKHLDRNDIFNEAFIIYKDLLDKYNTNKKCKFTSYIHNYLPKRLLRELNKTSTYYDIFNKNLDFEQLDDTINNRKEDIVPPENDIKLDFKKDVYPKLQDILTETDILLLKYRYGLYDNEILSFKQMAKQGIVSDREGTIRQRHRRLMNKIRDNKDKIFKKEE